MRELTDQELIAKCDAEQFIDSCGGLAAALRAIAFVLECEKEAAQVGSQGDYEHPN